MWLGDLVKDQMALPSPDAKPEFGNVRCCLMNVDAEQTPFFYAADAATGKKVTLLSSRILEFSAGNVTSILKGYSNLL